MSARFLVLDADVPTERTLWEELWHDWPMREVAAHPAYLELFAEPGDRALAATFEGAHGRILYPFVLRPVPSPGDLAFTDITTAYGYGGPVFWGQGRPEDIATTFWTSFDDWAESHNVVSEFVRFSLFSDAQNWHPGDVLDRQPNVIVPVDVPDDILWRSFEAKVRKNVKRAQYRGVTVVVDLVGERVDEFLGIYRTTMDRREAAERYYFSREFFERIHEQLSGQFAYFHAYREGIIVSTELVLVSKSAVYSYLGGTHADAFPYRPNDLLKYEIIRWARDNGKQSFVLGGGVAPGDGIERYKRSFAPTGAKTFRTGQRILDRDTYDRLVVENRKFGSPPPTGFFPEYRW